MNGPSNEGPLLFGVSSAAAILVYSIIPTLGNAAWHSFRDTIIPR